MQKQKSVILSLMLLFLTISVPVAFSSSLGDEWSSIKNSLSSGEKSENVNESLSHVNDAYSIYMNSFKDAALEVDIDSDDLIQNAFGSILASYPSGDVSMNSLNRQVIDKTIYKIAFMQMELAIEKDNADDFVSWYSVLDKKFKVSEKDYESNHWIAEIKSDPSTLKSSGTTVLKEFLDIFKLKTFEEIEEAIAALEKGDTASAKKFTYEGLYYYRTLHPAIDAKLGSATANELLHEMEEAVEISMSDSSVSEKKSKLEHIASEVELILREYEGGNTSEIGLALSGIKDRLHLVEVEYLDAVSEGKIINQEEYDETVVFLTKTQSIFDSVKPSLMKLSESDAGSLGKHLNEIDLVVSSIGNTSEVSILVGKSLNNIASLENLTGGEVEIDIFQYFDEMERLLNEAKTLYRNGDSQKAFDFVSKAYLDNYEFVEGPLGEVDPELMIKIEIDMREDLRNMIKNNESSDSVDAQIDMILSDLASAKKVVPEFGTIAVMVLTVAIISIIALSSKSKLSILPKL